MRIFSIVLLFYFPLTIVWANAQSCGRKSPAFKEKYIWPSFYIPDSIDEPYTLRISFNIFQKSDGTGNFTDSDSDRTVLLGYILKNLNNYYTNNAVTWAGIPGTLHKGPSDKIPGIVEVPDTKIRFDIGDPGKERIFYYRDDKLHQEYDLNTLMAFIKRDSSRTAPDKELNMFFTEGSLPSLPTAKAHATMPSFDIQSDMALCYFKLYDDALSERKKYGAVKVLNVSTLLHEVGHVLDLNHTYSGGGASAICTNEKDPEYLSDVFGPSEQGNCPHLGGTQNGINYFNYDSYASPTDKVTNNVMGGNKDACYFSPQQAGMMIRSLHLKTNRKYVVLKYHSGKPVYIEKDELWDFDSQFYSDIYVEKGTTFTLACSLNLPEEARIIVNKGATLILDGGSINNIHTSEGLSKVVILKRGGNLIVK